MLFFVCSIDNYRFYFITSRAVEQTTAHTTSEQMNKYDKDRE